MSGILAAEPAFHGFVETTLDALLIFEGCRRGILPKITRRLQETEKRALVDSGSVFVFDEEDTGIKRWTDGLIWSPSRTLGNFLLYRELVKKPTKAAKTDGTGSANSSSAEDPPAPPQVSSSEAQATVASTSRADDSRRRSFSEASGTQLDRARERALVGSLTSSTRFRSDGLVKKTISLAGVHMICYYRIEDVTSGRLRTPSSHPELMSMEISPDMLAPSLFRVPPVIEIGMDGQVRYKAESDTPMSPNTRPTSSSDLPALTQPRSRPASSDSTSGRNASPLLAPLPIGLPRGAEALPQSSPSVHRASIGPSRASGRFDPYSYAGRPVNTSPSTATFPLPGSYTSSSSYASQSYTAAPRTSVFGSQPSASAGASWPGESAFDASAPLNRPAQDQPAMYGAVEHDPYASQDTYARDAYPVPPGSSGGIFSYQPPPPSRDGPAMSSGPTAGHALYTATIPTTSPAYAGHQMVGHRHVSDSATATGHGYGAGYAGPSQTVYNHNHPPATAPAQYHQRPRHTSSSGPSLAFRPASSTSLYESQEYDYDNRTPSIVYDSSIRQPYTSHAASRVYGNYVSQSLPPTYDSSKPPRALSSATYPSGLVGSTAGADESDESELVANDPGVAPVLLPGAAVRSYPPATRPLNSYNPHGPSPMGFGHSVGLDAVEYPHVKPAAQAMPETRQWWTPPPTTATAAVQHDGTNGVVPDPYASQSWQQ
ncbi:hypothetical protein ACM66B_001123 [Microbotryomycetes sp. NB124-2]